jgi:precorrin-6B methylase 2
MPFGELVERASQFHPWDAMAPAALEGILKRGPFRRTAETGCGGSTVVLSQISEQHTAFAIEGEQRTITGLRNWSGFRGERVTFVEGESRNTVPGWRPEGELDLVLLDGPHAYPMPQVEFAYLFRWLRVGGWLVMDDVQIPSVYELFRFLEREPGVVLEEVVVRTAFFRRLAIGQNVADGWESQAMNRGLVWRYSWRDRLRRLLGRG